MLKVTGVAMFSLSFLLLAVAVPCAGTATSAGRSTDNEHFSLLTWLHGLTHTANHRRGASLPPLPRPRPADFAVAPNPSSKAPAVVPLYD
jgi:hypothetical protein